MSLVWFCCLGFFCTLLKYIYVRTVRGVAHCNKNTLHYEGNVLSNISFGDSIPSGIANMEHILVSLLSKERLACPGSYCSISKLIKARQTHWLTQQLGHSLGTLDSQVHVRNIGFWQINPFQHESLSFLSLQQPLAGSAFWSLTWYTFIFISLQAEEAQPMQGVYLSVV